MEQLFNGNFEYQPRRMRSRNHSVCHLQVLKQGNAVLVIATELHSNPGKSITNSNGPLAEAVVSNFSLCPPVQQITWIEHYNDQTSYGHSDGLYGSRSEHDSYAQVSYTWEYSEQGYIVTQEEYSHITAEEVERLHSFKPTITLNLSGSDGNIFAVMMHAAKALREAGQGNQVAGMREATTSQHNYKDALAAIGQYVEIVDVSADKEE